MLGYLYTALYGLRQSSWAWHIRLKKELDDIGFRASIADPGLFIYRDTSGDNAYLLVYVDDFLVASKNRVSADLVVAYLKAAFDVQGSRIDTNSLKAATLTSPSHLKALQLGITIHPPRQPSSRACPHINSNSLTAGAHTPPSFLTALQLGITIHPPRHPSSRDRPHIASNSVEAAAHTLRSPLTTNPSAWHHHILSPSAQQSRASSHHF